MNIKSFFLSALTKAPFLIQLKAAALVYVSLGFAGLFCFLAIATPVFKLSTKPLASVMAYIVAITVFIAVLIILKRGYYLVAANFMIIFMTLLILAYILTQIGNISNFMGILHFSYLVTILAGLFATRTILTVSTVLLTAGWITCYSLGSPILDPSHQPLAWKTIIYFIIMLVLVYFACIAIISISNMALAKTEMESGENKKHRDVLEKILNSVKQISGSLGEATAKLSSTAMQFSSNAQGQASSIEEITASMEELSAGIDGISENADSQNSDVLSLTEKSAQFSRAITAIKKEIESMIISVEKIMGFAREGNQNLENMKTGMQKIQRSSDEMTGIINIINDISDKINLLSLNAAIEAARAGEAGRGFAVVADEISKLADQTSHSVKSISTIISANEKEIANGSANVDKTVDSISRIIEGVSENFKSMEGIALQMESRLRANEEINVHMGALKTKSEEIKMATGEHRIAINEVVSTLSSINDITQANSAGAEQTYESIRELTSMSGSLNELINASDEIGPADPSA